MKLSELQNGDKALILHVGGRGAFRKRILEMGFVRGQVVEAIQSAPLRDPVYYRIMDYNVSLRRREGDLITIERLDATLTEEEIAARQARLSPAEFGSASLYSPGEDLDDTPTDTVPSIEKSVRIALIGNPNSGKTTLFNLASGAHERVGNYSGVTVEAKEAVFVHKGVRYEIIDLPGSYSLSPYSPEELYIREYLTSDTTRPDMVIDVIDTTSIERHLYLAIQVKELGIPMVISLNMWDEFEQKGNQLDVEQLSKLLGTQMIPTVCRKGEGISELFDAVSKVLTNDPYRDRRHIQINYGLAMEDSIETLMHKVAQCISIPSHLPLRYIAIKLLEEDRQVLSWIESEKHGDFIKTAVQYEQSRLQKENIPTDELESYITNQRYGFIAGALRETFRPNKRKVRSLTDKIDNILVHHVWGYPIFLLFIFIMFEATFVLGAFPMAWIEDGIDILARWVYDLMPIGPLRDLIVSGIIGGVGGVLVFLPNIMILYFFISVMEDTGYMARAAFLMDKLMHRMGLHGKSFIPLIMGFGCNVPAVMASRTIESKQSRTITMLVTPLMSCNARLLVYILIAGTFFPGHAPLILFGIYLLGVLLAVLLARLFRKAFFKEEDLPFVMELPPYRMPTSRAVAIHMWDKAREYLHKMGSIILVASIIVWFLSYFPRQEVIQEVKRQVAQVEQSQLSPSEKKEQIAEILKVGHIEQQRTSYLGQIGAGLQPIMAPLGFDWKLNVALVSGLPAKEVVVSTLSVIYTGQDAVTPEEIDGFLVGTSALSEQMVSEINPTTHERQYTPLTAIVFLIFVLIYMPCIATVVAISRELHSGWWGLFVFGYTCLLAWIVAYAARLIGLLIIG